MKNLMLNGIFGILLVSYLTGCMDNPVTGQRQFALISKDQEVAMGQEMAAEFEKEFDGLHPNATLQEYVKRVGSQIARQSDRDMPYEFALLNSSVPNAFALPGGKVYVTAGLFGIMENERQLAAVLGHEIGHVAAMHSVNTLQRQLGISILLEVAGMATKDKKYHETAQAVSEMTMAMVQLRYSRDQEYEADSVGVKYLERAGYNPWGMVELLEALLALGQQESGKLAELFMTHPLTTNRINEVKKLIAKKYPGYAPEAVMVPTNEFTKMKAVLTGPSGK